MIEIDPVELAQRFFEEANDAFIIFDPATREVVDVNPAFQRLTDWRKREVQGTPVTRHVFGETDTATHELLNAFSDTTFFHSREDFRLRVRDGSLLAVDISVS